MGVVVGLGLGSVTTAQGAMVSFSTNFGPSNVPFPAGVVGNLSKFDPALGTLTKVTLKVEANASGGSIAWDNEANVASDVTLGIGAEVIASALSALTATAMPFQIGNSSVEADNDGAPDFVGTDTFSVVGGTGSDSGSAMSMAAATLALFTGAGMFPVNVEAKVDTFLSTTGGFGPIDPVPGTTDGKVTVTYEFNFVPVPVAGWMGLAVLAGLALVATVRKSGFRCGGFFPPG